MPRTSLSLALGVTLAVGSACAKHEKAPQAASEAAPSNAAPVAPQDPKEVARASGLLGPADQGAINDDGFGSDGDGSVAPKTTVQGKGSAAATDNAKGSATTSTTTSSKTKTKKLAPNTTGSGPGGGPGAHSGQGAVDDLSGGGIENGRPTRGGQQITGSVGITEISAGDDKAKDPVRAAVAQHLGAIEACYRDTLARAPAVAGKFNVVFFVDPDGTFERADQLSSELGDGVMSDCIVRTVNGIKLDHALGGTQPIKVGVLLSFKHT